MNKFNSAGCKDLTAAARSEDYKQSSKDGDTLWALRACAVSPLQTRDLKRLQQVRELLSFGSRLGPTLCFWAVSFPSQQCSVDFISAQGSNFNGTTITHKPSASIPGTSSNKSVGIWIRRSGDSHRDRDDINTPPPGSLRAHRCLLTQSNQENKVGKQLVTMQTSESTGEVQRFIYFFLLPSCFLFSSSRILNKMSGMTSLVFAICCNSTGAITAYEREINPPSRSKTRRFVRQENTSENKTQF